MLWIGSKSTPRCLPNLVIWGTQRATFGAELSYRPNHTFRSKSGDEWEAEKRAEEAEARAAETQRLLEEAEEAMAFLKQATIRIYRI